MASAVEWLPASRLEPGGIAVINLQQAYTASLSAQYDEHSVMVIDYHHSAYALIGLGIKTTPGQKKFSVKVLENFYSKN